MEILLSLAIGIGLSAGRIAFSAHLGTVTLAPPLHPAKPAQVLKSTQSTYGQINAGNQNRGKNTLPLLLRRNAEFFYDLT